MKEVFDFLDGTISMEEFVSLWKTNPAIADWLQSLIDQYRYKYDSCKDSENAMYRNAIVHSKGGSIRAFLEPNMYEKKNGIRYYYHRDGFFKTILSVVEVVYPDCAATTLYEDQKALYDYAAGETIGGPEVEMWLGKIFEETLALPTRGRKKIAKERVRADFPCEKRYPVWVQEPEWPMGEKRPMKYLSRRRDGDLVQFTFEDLDTHATRIVEQFY